jgi:hypothetical protein
MLFQSFLLPLLDFPGMEAKQNDVLFIHEREPGPDTTQFFGSLPDHMRHAHGVEDSRAGRGWCIQINVTIEV